MTQSFFCQQILFQAMATLFIVVGFLLLSKRLKNKEPLGFLYLFSLPAKLFFFYYFFPLLFDPEQALSPEQKGHIIGPLLFFLCLEVLLVAKILNQKPSANI